MFLPAVAVKRFDELTDVERFGRVEFDALAELCYGFRVLSGLDESGAEMNVGRGVPIVAPDRHLKLRKRGIKLAVRYESVSFVEIPLGLFMGRHTLISREAL